MLKNSKDRASRTILQVTEGTLLSQQRASEWALVGVGLSQCVHKPKAWNWIPTFLWLYGRRVRKAAALHMSFHATFAQPTMLSRCCLPLFDNKIVLLIFVINAAYFGTTHPTPAGKLAQSKFSLPSSVPRIQPLAVKGANHMLAPNATNTLWQRGKHFPPSPASVKNLKHTYFI